MCLAIAVGSCSLGLDPSLIGRSSPSIDAGTTLGSGADASSRDSSLAVATVDAGDPLQGGTCVRNADCEAAALAAGACIGSSTCDVARGQCAFTVCAANACSASTCELSTKSCSSPKAFGVAAGHFHVAQGGVGGFGTSDAISAVYPFVFLITTNGVYAYDVIDPTTPTPPVVPVRGVSFAPSTTLVIGRRVYFVGPVEGNGPAYHEQIAWIDVPNNPFVAAFQAASATVATTTTPLDEAYPNGGGGLFFAYASTALEPTASAGPLLDDATSLVPVPNAGLAAGAVIVASSGTRLVAFRYDATNSIGDFALVTGAATASAQASPEQALSDAPTDGEAMFTSGADGSVLWTAGLYQTLNAGSVASASIMWLLADGTTTTFDSTKRVDLELYSAYPSTPTVAQSGWIDSNTALGLAAAAESPTSTSVQVVTRQPLGVRSGTRTVISVSPTAVGVATSNGFGYVLAADDSMNLTASVYVFAPGCGAGSEP
jgi:hypothetical protein